MAQDIAPELYKKIAADFNRGVEGDKELNRLIARIKAGKATQKDVSKYTYLLGEHASDALSGNITLSELPDKTLYWNIAARTIRPVMQKVYDGVNAQAVIQQRLSDRAKGIGVSIVKGQDPQNRIRGVMNAACASRSEEALHKALTVNVETTARAYYDDFQEANMDARATVGFEPVVIRTYSGIGLHGGKDPCQFCLDRAGEWTMTEAHANGVFQRHEGCGCEIEVVYPDRVEKQTNWKHNEWNGTPKDGIINTRKENEPTKLLASPDKEKFAEAIQDRPELLANYTPVTFKRELEERGFDVRPLGIGHHKGVPFESGGGFIANYGGNGALEYHPSKQSRHGGRYYRLSDSIHGRRWFDMNGHEIDREATDKAGRQILK